jgi:hypothetical protein
MKLFLAMAFLLVLLIILSRLHEHRRSGSNLKSRKFQRKETFKNINDKKYSVYVNTIGGLGNQLFQIAAAYGLSMAYNMNLYVINNQSSNLHDNNSKYLTSIFNDFSYVEDEEEGEGCTSITEDFFKFSIYYITLPANKNVIINGYFQNEKYFKQYKRDLIRMFKNNSIYDQVKNEYENNLKNSYFIHVRMGDYLKSHYHAVDLSTYYKSVINYIRNVLDQDATFYVFSDELTASSAPDYLRDRRFYFVKEKKALNSLYMMSLCLKGGICANSSFSWWGSYLNENDDKFVTFPSRWVNCDKNVTVDIYYEKSMIFEV